MVARCLTFNRKRKMMRREKFAIANIYVPVKRRATLDPKDNKIIDIID